MSYMRRTFSFIFVTIHHTRTHKAYKRITGKTIKRKDEKTNEIPINAIICDEFLFSVSIIPNVYR